MSKKVEKLCLVDGDDIITITLDDEPILPLRRRYETHAGPYISIGGAILAEVSVVIIYRLYAPELSFCEHEIHLRPGIVIKELQNADLVFGDLRHPNDLTEKRELDLVGQARYPALLINDTGGIKG
ncbi:hypothetical protein F5887DRAFT_1079766 [Amanita rubescens]|nr:hypothetical protein F5887DRAFT_1079766 [Amanita rubescens]